jgi:hypothetical protein
MKKEGYDVGSGISDCHNRGCMKHKQQKNKLLGFSPRANYTDRAIALYEALFA